MCKNEVLIMCVCCLMLTGNVWATPSPVHIGVGPGINVPFDTDAEPVTWGQKDFQQGGWSYDGDSAKVDSVIGAVIRYDPTYSDTGSDGPMPTDEDWILEMVYKHTGVYGTESTIFTKANGTERLFKLSYTGSDDDWNIFVGQSASAWVAAPVATVTLSQVDWNNLTVHYKSASSNLDFYANDSLVAGNVSLAHGKYDLRLVQLEWMRAGEDWFRNFEVGQVPEPTTMVLAGLGGLALMRRRKV